jgi:hypothetical protein
MSEAERQLAEDRQNRAAARALFDRRMSQVKGDLDARGIGGRIKDSAVSKGEEAVAQGLEIARENKGILAATGAALALWLFRNPLIALIRKLSGSDQDSVQDPDASGDPDNEEY